MEIKDLTVEQLEEQIETYLHRIETMQNYISETDDDFTRENMTSQLRRYQMTFRALIDELNARKKLTVENTNENSFDNNVEESFIHQLLSAVLTRNITDEGYKFMRFTGAIKNFEINDIHYRWAKVGQRQLNLEFNIITPYGPLWKPIGFIHTNMGIVIMNEFIIEAMKVLQENKENLKVITLDTKESAIIGAFSYEMVQACLQRKDIKIKSNGLNFDVFINFDGNPQVFLDDKYNEELGPLAVYQFESDSLNIAPSAEYKELFEEFIEVRFLTAFTVEE